MSEFILRDDIDLDVHRERMRQEQKFGATGQTCANPKMPNLERLAVLAEEFGEVSKAVCEAQWDGAGENLIRDELVQVAAVAKAWVEGLDAARLDGAA